MIRNPTLPMIPLCFQVLGVALGLGYSYLFHANRRRKQLLSDFVRTIHHAFTLSTLKELLNSGLSSEGSALC